MRSLARLLVSLSPCLLVFVATLSGSQLRYAHADVIVLANRTNVVVPVQLKGVLAAATNLSLPAGEVVPIFIDGKAFVTFASRGETKRYLLDANSAYYFGRAKDGHIDMSKIGLGDDRTTAEGRTLPGRAATAPSVTIPVKVFVDDDEPAKPMVWERRLRQRLEAASAVLEQYARVNLKVVAVGTWDSDNATTDFFTSLGEFEQEVKPFPGRLAIGFTSQYQIAQGRVHLAGTRGAFHTHILVREWGQHMSEPERLELLVHELGHFLGAAHSPEQDSVMRPVLGNRQAVRAGFRVKFDPVNTLIMAMIGEEMRRRKIQQLSGLTVGTKQRLRQIYGALSPTMPQDPAANQFIRMVDVATATPLVSGTKQVLAEIVRSAQANRALSPADAAAPGQEVRRDNDALTEYYVRNAAGVAQNLPEEIGPGAFLLGLGIGLDDSDLLRSQPKVGDFMQLVESSDERAHRTSVLGNPTVQGRRDLAQHFAVSAYLTAVTGTQWAGAIGVAKELSDSNGGSGFSFVDMAANRAGIVFAGNVLNKKLPLHTLANGFAVATFVPSTEGLPEGLTAAEFNSQFGEAGDSRFLQQLQEIDRRVQLLPAYHGNSGIASER